MKTLSLRNIADHISQWHGKTAVVRVDFNVPVRDGIILDDSRIKASVATIQFLMKNDVSVRILTHFGRPKGKDAQLSTQFLCAPLKALVGEDVVFCEDLLPTSARLVLYQNVRFYEGEEANAANFSEQLSRLGDVYINDAFSVCHRAHASTEGITQYLPSYAGLTLAHEVRELEKGLLKPELPLFAILGGAKVSSKWDVLNHILPKVQRCYIGGGMANTFVRAQGANIGASLVENDLLESAMQLLEAFSDKIVLPHDFVVTDSLSHPSTIRTSLGHDIRDDEMIVDIGKHTIATWSESLTQAKTIVWNGPLGVFEVPPFHKATIGIMSAVAQASREHKLYSVVGGGETVAAAHAAHVYDDIGFVSTAGGAFLEWLEGRTLPGIFALQNREST